jgi:hypothetical protein
MQADKIFKELSQLWLPEVVLLDQMLIILEVVAVEGRQACH